MSDEIGPADLARLTSRSAWSGDGDDAEGRDGGCRHDDVRMAPDELPRCGHCGTTLSPDALRRAGIKGRKA